MIAPAAPLVFVVDDDPSVRKSLARLVRAAGYDVEVFASAREFLARPVPESPCCLSLSRARQVRRDQTRLTEIQDRIKTLTPRETEVFALVVTGMLNKQNRGRARRHGEEGQGASGPGHGEDAGRVGGRVGPAG
jgi:FixJ family two-component response regulator